MVEAAIGAARERRRNSMKYMVSLYGDEAEWEAWTPDEMKATMDEMEAFNRQLVEAGVLVAGEGLQPSRTATTVRFNEDGSTVVTDGPFAETKEQLSGYWVLECENLDQALEWTRKAPLRGAVVEVRPLYGTGEPLSLAEYERAQVAAREAFLGETQAGRAQ
jgi:hypothetical protein